MNYTYEPEQIARIISYYNPSARAILQGSIEYPDIYGEVRFYKVNDGVLVVITVDNLPETPDRFYGFHLHSGGSCTGNAQDSFANAGSHYNPEGKPHPQHSGDFPPIIAKDGSAFLAFVTNRFTIPEIIGKTVVIHLMPDDFTTQPSGNSGEKIACGVIRE
jgi:Cu-Zn family superoxide dismutase